MKLYTEEQMSVAINVAKANPEQAYLIQAMLKPIELPSDEEIDIARDEYIPIDEIDMWSERFYFNIGAKWMRDKLIPKPNETK